MLLGLLRKMDVDEELLFHFLGYLLRHNLIAEGLSFGKIIYDYEMMLVEYGTDKKL